MVLTADDQLRRARMFQALHGAGTFVVPNPWDAGTARLLPGLGYPALATTSAGLAFALGRGDGVNLLERDETLDNARAIVAATALPVSADLESGFGRTPAETIRRAAAAGLVGGSIEDATGDPDRPIRPLAEAAERVAAAAEAAKALPFPFTLTARAENFLYGTADLDDTMARLQAYEAAGPDVLYAPALPDLDAVRAVVTGLDRPVNVRAGPAGAGGGDPACPGDPGDRPLRRSGARPALFRPERSDDRKARGSARFDPGGGPYRTRVNHDR
jgi:2-methylisocitrate lyase-like PEP mutase family enzyme